MTDAEEATGEPEATTEPWPGWVPEAARSYLAHTERGRTIRALAREARVAPSTISRRVRRVEAARDDPLVDSALQQLSDPGAGDPARAAVAIEAAPVLRRLIEPGTILAVGRSMEKGVVLRDDGHGEPQRLAVVERRLAEAMALQDWIGCDDPDARVSRYRITARGRTLARRLTADPGARGLAESQAAFRSLGIDEAGDDPRLRHMRSLLAESPLVALARRRDRDGAPFLGREHVAAGERLREDFEIAQRDGAAPDWAQVLAGGGVPGPVGGGAWRVGRALHDLGPGLAEACFYCCCRLDGIEAVEARMGWSARSGKVVLRIGLDRLRRHYREGPGELGPYIR